MNNDRQLLLDFDNVYWKKDPRTYLELLNLTKNFRNSFICRLTFPKYRNAHILNFINDSVPDEVDRFKLNLRDKIFWVLEGLTNFPRCHLCGKKLKRHVISVVLGFRRHRDSVYIYCSQQHKNADPDYRNRISHVQHEMYINEDVLNDRTRRIKDTKRERYGDPNYTNREKAKQTSLKNWNVDNPFKSPEVREKSKETLHRKYGENVDNPFQAEEVKEMIKNTCKRRYGVEFISQSPKFQAHVAEICMSKFGTRSPSFTYIYDGKSFDSSWELCYYIWLTDKGINFSYPSGIEFLFEHDGRSHRYIPDFIVDGHPVELKGNQFFDKDENFINPYCSGMSAEQINEMNSLYAAKYECMKSNGVTLLREDDMKPIFQHIQQKYDVKSHLIFCRQFKRQSK